VLLKSQTEYSSPYSATHPVIVLFWEMMESFTHLERSAFIKFVWSRDRLPIRSEDFSSRFKITRLSTRGPADQAFPKSHTCFFTIDIPEYSNLASMTDRIRYAIENCTAIDTDGGGGNFDMPPGAGGGSDSEDEGAGSGSDGSGDY
jgi:hypothetical protein